MAITAKALMAILWPDNLFAKEVRNQRTGLRLANTLFRLGGGDMVLPLGSGGLQGTF